MLTLIQNEKALFAGMGGRQIRLAPRNRIFHQSNMKKQKSGD
jgi:hypothetical protein